MPYSVSAENRNPISIHERRPPYETVLTAPAASDFFDLTHTVRLLSSAVQYTDFAETIVNIQTGGVGVGKAVFYGHSFAVVDSPPPVYELFGDVVARAELASPAYENRGAFLLCGFVGYHGSPDANNDALMQYVRFFDFSDSVSDSDSSAAGGMRALDLKRRLVLSDFNVDYVDTVGFAAGVCLINDAVAPETGEQEGVFRIAGGIGFRRHSAVLETFDPQR